VRKAEIQHGVKRLVTFGRAGVGKASRDIDSTLQAYYRVSVPRSCALSCFSFTMDVMGLLCRCSAHDRVSIFIWLPPTFAFELCATGATGLRLPFSGVRGGCAGRGAESKLVFLILSNSVSHAKSESKSNTIAPLALIMLRRGVPSH
jgi:hypothetical protein